MITTSSSPFLALLKIAVFDKKAEATLVWSLMLQYKRNQKSRNFSIVDVYIILIANEGSR